MINVTISSENGMFQRLEVWDNGIKLGNSPLGWNTTSLFVGQSYVLDPGTHQMTIQDIGLGANNPVLHTKVINFSVQ